MAASLVGTYRAGLMAGREFVKMSGSGNDFVVFDARVQSPAGVTQPDGIRALCARGTGVGADGVILIERSERADFRMSYFNSDGSRAEMCGNAALCVCRLAADLGIASGEGMRFDTDAGEVVARACAGTLAEVDLQPVSEVEPAAPLDRWPGERRIGFALAGVPHLVVLCNDVTSVDVVGRGRALRQHKWQPRGANVNFVSPSGGRSWSVRTYERGVEGETLACGTGAVATAVLLDAWGESEGEISLITRSGSPLTVTLRRSGSTRHPSLRGEARKVFAGMLLEI